jgi:hypothetical protein
MAAVSQKSRRTRKSTFENTLEMEIHVRNGCSGKIYECGTGVPVNHHDAVKWYMHYSREDVPRDVEQALYWASQGYRSRTL